MSKDKYTLIPTDMKTPDGKPLYQVCALRDFASVKAGDLGGYVEGGHNLAQDGDAWIFGAAIVSGGGCVSDRPVAPDDGDPEPTPCHRPGWRPGLSRGLSPGRSARLNRG